MKVVVALDKFKGSLTASRACEIVRDTLLSIHPDWRVVSKPMADGGDGTADVLHAALGGQRLAREVSGPIPGTRVHASYLWLERDRMAVVEMASASGLALVTPEQRDPLKTTTFGTGELIGDAVTRGARRILLGVGGSATVDGGVGAAMALGWRFLDGRGGPVGLGGGELGKIERIVPPSDPQTPAVEVLCDVDNPLCGERGAARVFGPQKGATTKAVEQTRCGATAFGEVGEGTTWQRHREYSRCGRGRRTGCRGDGVFGCAVGAGRLRR